MITLEKNRFIVKENLGNIYFEKVSERYIDEYPFTSLSILDIRKFDGGDDEFKEVVINNLNRYYSEYNSGGIDLIDKNYCEWVPLWLINYEKSVVSFSKYITNNYSRMFNESSQYNSFIIELFRFISDNIDLMCSNNNGNPYNYLINYLTRYNFNYIQNHILSRIDDNQNKYEKAYDLFSNSVIYYKAHLEEMLK